ncbi:MAG: hypothetical protein AAGC78_13365 [Cellvibrio sp.]|uniref:hypothetical protein n=1 Tax=Cellvibrio sp. TaxID=1965322 RepID=UPI0031A079E8
MYGDKRLMIREDYLTSINEYLISLYAITFADTGYSEDEWLSRFGDLDVDDAIESYADKYGLTKASEWS